MFQKTGMEVTLGRWFAWEDKSLQLMEHRVPLLLLLLYIGTKRSWWRSLLESPPFEVQKEPDEESGGGGTLAAAGRDLHHKETVANSNHRLNRRRSGSKNSLHLACKILGDPFVRRVHRGVVLLEGPLRKFLGQSEVKAKTQQGTTSMLSDPSGESWRLAIAEIFELFFSASFASALEFPGPHRRVSRCRRACRGRQGRSHFVWLRRSLVGELLDDEPAFQRYLPIHVGRLGQPGRRGAARNPRKGRRPMEYLAGLGEGDVAARSVAEHAQPPRLAR